MHRARTSPQDELEQRSTGRCTKRDANLLQYEKVLHHATLSLNIRAANAKINRKALTRLSQRLLSAPLRVLAFVNSLTCFCFRL